MSWLLDVEKGSEMREAAVQGTVVVMRSSDWPLRFPSHVCLVCLYHVTIFIFHFILFSYIFMSIPSNSWCELPHDEKLLNKVG